MPIRRWAGEYSLAKIDVFGEHMSLLALVVSIPSYAIEDFLIFRADIWGTWFADGRVTFVVYMIVLMPLVEETVCVQVVRLAEKRRWLIQPASLRTAIQFGSLIALCEWFAKTIWLQTTLGLISHLSSFPIHIALSCAFFSFRSERFVKTLALHCLINATILASGAALVAYGLSYAANPAAYTAALLAVVCIVSGLVAATPASILRRQLVSVHNA